MLNRHKTTLFKSPIIRRNENCVKFLRTRGIFERRSHHSGLQWIKCFRHQIVQWKLEIRKTQRIFGEIVTFNAWFRDDGNFLDALDKIYWRRSKYSEFTFSSACFQLKNINLAQLKPKNSFTTAFYESIISLTRHIRNIFSFISKRKLVKR